MTIADEQAPRAADAQQAAYFRAELEAERRLLLAGNREGQALIDDPTDVGRSSHSSITTAATLRQLDHMIARLDVRFALSG